MGSGRELVVSEANHEDAQEIYDLIRGVGARFEDSEYLSGHLPDGYDVLVARRGRLVVGWLEGTLEHALVESQAWIAQVAVHPDYQRPGVGRALVEEYMRRERLAGREWIATTPSSADDRYEERVSFFEALGFEVVIPPEPEGRFHNVRRRL